MALTDSHWLHGTIPNPGKLLWDVRRWGVGLIPVEISSCTNKARWITKSYQERSHSIFMCTCSMIVLVSRNRGMSIAIISITPRLIYFTS